MVTLVVMNSQKMITSTVPLSSTVFQHLLPHRFFCPVCNVTVLVHYHHSQNVVLSEKKAIKINYMLTA